MIATPDATAAAFISGVLRVHRDPVVIRRSTSAHEVVDSIESDRPDLVFLDVDLGTADAFDVIESVGSSGMPPVVLIAATPDFAARAFEVGAIDYLVRPLSRRRITRALNRSRDRVLHERALVAAGRLLDRSPRAHAEASSARIIVRAGNRVVFIDPAEIDWIEAGHNYVRLHVGARTYRVRRTMTALEASLHDHQFARIHRGILVRLARIRELRLKSGWRCGAVLKTGVILPVSRTYRMSLLRQLGGGSTRRAKRYSSRSVLTGSTRVAR